MKRKALRWLISGPLLFLLGILLELGLSSLVVWGELEASFLGGQHDALSLDLHCPIMLSPVESGTISASITNTIEEQTSPEVKADISRAGGDQELSQILVLAPHETRLLQWKIDASDIVFGNLILVDIYQDRYRDLPAREGSCGIYILSLFGLSGTESFWMLSVLALACISFGAMRWLKAHSPLAGSDSSFASANGVLVGFTTAGLLAAFVRWWGLILFLDAISLILMVVIFTEFLLFPGRMRN